MPDCLEPRYTPLEVAAVLAVKIDQIILLINSGEFNGGNIAKPGASRHHWTIRKSDREAFEESRRNRRPDRAPKERKAKADNRFSGVREFY